MHSLRGSWRGRRGEAPGEGPAELPFGSLGLGKQGEFLCSIACLIRTEPGQKPEAFKSYAFPGGRGLVPKGRGPLISLPLPLRRMDAACQPRQRDRLLTLDWLGCLFISHLLGHLPRAGPVPGAGVKKQVRHHGCPPTAPSLGEGRVLEGSPGDPGEPGARSVLTDPWGLGHLRQELNFHSHGFGVCKMGRIAPSRG